MDVVRRVILKATLNAMQDPMTFGVGPQKDGNQKSKMEERENRRKAMEREKGEEELPQGIVKETERTLGKQAKLLANISFQETAIASGETIVVIAMKGNKVGKEKDHLLLSSQRKTRRQRSKLPPWSSTT